MITQVSEISQADLLFFWIALAIALIVLVIVRRLLHVSTPYFFLGIAGLIIGLWIGSFLGRPLETLPGIYGRYLPSIVQIVVAVGTLDLFIAQSSSSVEAVRSIGRRLLARAWRDESSPANLPEYILDTSVLIDARIEGIVKTGFLSGLVVVPRFVLAELQSIADSAEPVKRSKGRRGLEILTDLQKDQSINFSVLDANNRQSKEPVDARLVKLAKRRSARLVTVDHNLAKVAAISGVEVLNIHELAHALKPQLLPGENMSVRVVQPGKGRGQGVGFLPDGTMIVVAGGAKHVGEDLEVEVERIFQTVSGKMVFVRPITK